MCGTFELFDLFSVFVVIPCCFLHSKYAYLFVKVYTVGAVYTLDFFLLPTLQRLAVFISLLFFFWQDKLLRYLGWSLNDKASSVRALALQVKIREFPEKD